MNCCTYCRNRVLQIKHTNKLSKAIGLVHIFIQGVKKKRKIMLKRWKCSVIMFRLESQKREKKIMKEQ
jgi:hypothetical protein